MTSCKLGLFNFKLDFNFSSRPFLNMQPFNDDFKSSNLIYWLYYHHGCYTNAYLVQMI